MSKKFEPLPKSGNQKNVIDQNRLIQNYLREQPNGATNHHSNGDASSHHSNGDASSHHSNGDASSHHSNSGATNQDDYHVQPYSSCNNRGTNRVVKICEIFHKYSKHNDSKNNNTTKRLIELLIQICVVG